ncbi:putative tetratricopeptide [Colletotrichum sp. SAR11_59]|nr:putative tetratricopeptide [Colletotrichum sp. SAR11_59]
MASSSPPLESSAARERGNGFYRKGQFTEAEKAYREAAALAPEDPAPWSNISAIRFEQGDYTSCLQNLEKALSLSSSDAKDEPKKQKLYTRMAKCHMHLMSFEAAESAIKSLGVDTSSQSLKASLEDLKGLRASVQNGDKLRTQTCDRVARYKASLQDIPEYYAVGHDFAEPLLQLDEPLWELLGPKDMLSFLLCGSGDARHLFVSIATLFFQDMMNQRKGKNKAFSQAYFTIIDINAAALARTLIMFDMGFRYAAMKTQKMPRIEDALTIMSYMFSSAFMPSFAAEKMLEHIRTVIDELEEQGDGVGSDFMGMFYLPRETRIQVVRKLKQWAEPLGEKYATKRLRPLMMENLEIEKFRRSLMLNFDATKVPYENRSDLEFNELGVVFGSQVFIKRREPELLPLLDAFRSGQQSSKAELLKHIDTHWVTNPTVLDMDYQPRREQEIRASQGLSEVPPGFDWNPAEMIKNLRSILSTEKEEDVLKIVSEFFEHFSIAMMTLHSRIKIEVIAGEMADVLDRIRHGNLKHRLQRPNDVEAIDPTQFPRDDYIGGPLAAFLTGGPLLRQDRPSKLRFNNLLNPPMFKSHDQFLAEYVLMHDAKEVESNFGVTREKNPNPPEVDETALLQMFGGNKFAIEDYFIWAKSSNTTARGKRLMSRSALERWLYLHLLKICLPYHRPKLSDRPVHAPLNLTTFLRIVGHMHDVGYPAHWLSGVLSSVCEGSISTTARAPRELVVSPENLSTSYPQRKICLNPWRAEFTTLLSLWTGLFPFGIIAMENALVPAEKVVECNVAFPEFFEAQGRVMHFVLAIFNTTEVDPRNFDLRELLSDDEAGNSSDAARKFRENSVHIVTAFRFSTATRTATFWMRQDVLDEFTSTDSWQICICRTDSWEEVRSRVSASESMSRIGTWERE